MSSATLTVKVVAASPAPVARVTRPPRPGWLQGSPDVVFVFPSGGSGGAAQVGILRSLLEHGIRPDAVVGSSVGALNATFFAQHPCLAQVDRLARIWLGLSRRDVFGGSRSSAVARLVARRSHIYDPDALRTLISRFCTVASLDDCLIPVHVVTTDLELGVARWWTSGPAGDLLYASACLPGLFPPAVLGGHRHVDGGVLEPVPIRRAVDLDAAVIYVLGDVRGPEDSPPSRLTAIDVLVRSFAISRYAPLPDPSALGRSGQQVVVVPGADTRSVDITDFRHTARLIGESRQAARAFLSGDRADGSAAARMPGGAPEALLPESVAAVEDGTARASGAGRRP